MRKSFLLVLAVFLLISCGFKPDKAEVQHRINEALQIDLPGEYKIIKSYNARAIDDFLESFVIEFTDNGYASFNSSIQLDEWKRAKKGYTYSKQLDERRRVIITLNPDNRQLHYQHFHH